MTKCLSAVLAIMLVLTVTVTTSAAFENNGYLGFQLPRPITIPDYIRSKRLIMSTEVHPVRLVLSLDNEGNVTLVLPEKAPDSIYANAIADYLRSWKWEPATFDGEKVESRICAAVTFQAGHLNGEVYYPGHPRLSDATSNLKIESLKLNGVEPPRLKLLPPLSLLLDKNDTSSYCPFVVMRLKLDSTGALESSTPVRSNAPQHLDKLGSAMLWSEFEPARINGRTVSSEIMIAMAFNRNLNYPTAAWRSCCLDDLNLLQRESVRLLTDTANYLIPPIPQLPPGDGLSLGRGHDLKSDTIICMVQVNKLGKALWSIRGRAHTSEIGVIKTIRKSLRFFPAIDSDGNPAAFEGNAMILRIDSKTVRIEYSWLNQGRVLGHDDKAKDDKGIRQF